ncbi:uncharacterized protein OCT59_011834 [Rhizophagus irregularis]|uniref:uncharacterized protein n=1 Tax=Rhizophagus irregularis TaxID=588596 RepID=UPI00332B16DE|nr:hypothetical protein OCT59_011834 [Rhizophagus irregularis]
MEQSSDYEQNYGRCMKCKQTSISLVCQTCDSNLKEKYGMCKKCEQIKSINMGWCYACIYNYREKKFVALKVLNNSKNLTLEFINEITLHIKIIEDKKLDQVVRCHGISQEPSTKNYIMVMKYAKKGNLRKYLNERRCLDADPSNRPNALDLSRIISKWSYEIHSYLKSKENQKELIQTELTKQIEEIIKNNRLSAIKNLKNKPHPGAIYTSRLLNFNNLPKPKNPDDYYSNYDDISSMQYPVYSDYQNSHNTAECLDCEIVD